MAYQHPFFKTLENVEKQRAEGKSVSQIMPSITVATKMAPLAPTQVTTGQKVSRYALKPLELIDKIYSPVSRAAKAAVAVAGSGITSLISGAINAKTDGGFVNATANAWENTYKNIIPSIYKKDISGTLKDNGIDIKSKYAEMGIDIATDPLAFLGAKEIVEPARGILGASKTIAKGGKVTGTLRTGMRTLNADEAAKLAVINKVAKGADVAESLKPLAKSQGTVAKILNTDNIVSRAIKKGYSSYEKAAKKVVGENDILREYLGEARFKALEKEGIMPQLRANVRNSFDESGRAFTNEAYKEHAISVLDSMGVTKMSPDELAKANKVYYEVSPKIDDVADGLSLQKGEYLAQQSGKKKGLHEGAFDWEDAEAAIKENGIYEYSYRSGTKDVKVQINKRQLDELKVLDNQAEAGGYRITYRPPKSDVLSNVDAGFVRPGYTPVPAGSRTVKRLKADAKTGPIEETKTIFKKVDLGDEVEYQGDKYRVSVVGEKDSNGDRLIRLDGKDKSKVIMQSSVPNLTEVKKVVDSRTPVERYIEEQSIFRGQAEEFKDVQKVSQSDAFSNILIGRGVFTTSDKSMASTYGKNIFQFKKPKEKIFNLANASEKDLRKVMPESFFTEHLLPWDKSSNTSYELYVDLVKNGEIKKAEDVLWESLAENFTDGRTWNEIMMGQTAIEDGPLADEVRDKVVKHLTDKGFDWVQHQGGIRAGGGETKHDVYIALRDEVLKPVDKTKLEREFEKKFMEEVSVKANLGSAAKPVMEIKQTKAGQFVLGGKNERELFFEQRRNMFDAVLEKVGGNQKKATELMTAIEEAAKAQVEKLKFSKDMPLVKQITAGEGFKGSMRYMDIPNWKLNEIGEKMGIKGLATTIKDSFALGMSKTGIGDIGTKIRARSQWVDAAARTKNFLKFEANPFLALSQWTEAFGIKTLRGGGKQEGKLINELGKDAGRTLQETIEDARVRRFDKYLFDNTFPKAVSQEIQRLGQGTKFDSWSKMEDYLKGVLTGELDTKKIDDITRYFAGDERIEMLVGKKKRTFEEGIELYKQLADRRFKGDIQEAIKYVHPGTQPIFTVMNEASATAERMIRGIAQLSYVRGGLEKSANYLFFPTSYVVRMTRFLAQEASRPGGIVAVKGINQAKTEAKAFLEKTYGADSKLMPNTLWVMEQLIPIGLSDLGASMDPLARSVMVTLGLGNYISKPSNLIKSYIPPYRNLTELESAMGEIKKAWTTKAVASGGVKIKMTPKAYEIATENLSYKPITSRPTKATVPSGQPKAKKIVKPTGPKQKDEEAFRKAKQAVLGK